MEEPKFRNRTERLEWYKKQMGWAPLTDEDKFPFYRNQGLELIENQ